MSLTSILKDKNHQELRDKLIQEFPKPEFKINLKIKCEPRSEDYGIVGTALDYLIRFHIEHLTPGTAVEKKKWMADTGYERLISRLSGGSNAEFKTANAVYNRKDLLISLKSQYEMVKNDYEDYLYAGKLRNTLIDGAVFLAKLDLFVRTGLVHPRFEIGQDANTLLDVKSLFDLAKARMDKGDDRIFRVNTKCYLNPTFGIGSVLVGGADADLIIDDTLIDIKTSRELKLERNDFNQILGYYILQQIGGVNENPKLKPVKNIGIYFARYGYLWTVPIASLGTAKQFTGFQKWFVGYMTKGEMDIMGFRKFVKKMDKEIKFKVV